MRGSILLSVTLSWAVVAAPLAEQQPSRTINIEARAPGNPLSPHYFQAAQPEVSLDSWGHPVDSSGFDVYGIPVAVTSSAPLRTFSPIPAHNSPSESDTEGDKGYDADSDDEWAGGAAAYNNAGLLWGQPPQ